MGRPNLHSCLRHPKLSFGQRDRLAGDVVPFEAIDTSQAVCAAAVAASPLSPRLEYASARAFEKAGRLDETKGMYLSGPLTTVSRVPEFDVIPSNGQTVAHGAVNGSPVSLATRSLQTPTCPASDQRTLPM